MSFGASPSDIIIVVTFARKLYRQCKTAGGEYLEISREVRGLHTVLRHLKDEVEAPDSVLNRDQARYGKELAPVIGDCDFTLRQLDGTLRKYGRLVDPDRGGAGRLWDKLRFGSAEMDELGGLRMKLINHKTSMTVFLDTIQLHESGRVSTVLDSQSAALQSHSAALDNHSGQLNTILDKVDGIAARMSQRAGSIMTTYDDDDKEVWKQFRRELVSEGFSSDVLQQHKDVLRAYIRQIDQNGLLEEVGPESEALSPVSPDTVRWLDSTGDQVQSPSSEQPPPSFNSLNMNHEDAGAKMLVAEENMKFPQSMKAEVWKHEKAEEGDASKQIVTPDAPKPAALTENIPRSPGIPQLVTSFNGLSVGAHEQRSQSPGSRAITTDTLPRGLDIPKSKNERPSSPSGTPLSYRSQASFADEIPRSMNRQHGATYPIPDKRSNEQYGRSPGISSDARWTQIRRDLVSPEILEEEGLRYELHTDFIDVFGALSRDDIADYAARTKELRSRRRPQPTSQPPPRPRARTQRQSTSSESSFSGSDDDVFKSQHEIRPTPRERRSEQLQLPKTKPRVSFDDEVEHDRRPTYKEHRSYPERGDQNDRGYRSHREPRATWPVPHEPGSPQYEVVSGEGRHHSGDGKKGKGKTKWRDGLAVAGFGGAAASLIAVLSEAADGF